MKTLPQYWHCFTYRLRTKHAALVDEWMSGIEAANLTLSLMAAVVSVVACLIVYQHALLLCAAIPLALAACGYQYYLIRPFAQGEFVITRHWERFKQRQPCVAAMSLHEQVHYFGEPVPLTQ